MHLLSERGTLQEMKLKNGKQCPECGQVNALEALTCGRCWENLEKTTVAPENNSIKFIKGTKAFQQNYVSIVVMSLLNLFM